MRYQAALLLDEDNRLMNDKDDPQISIPQIGEKISETSDHMKRASEEMSKAAEEMEGAAERARTMESGFRLRGQNLRAMIQRVKKLEEDSHNHK